MLAGMIIPLAAAEDLLEHVKPKKLWDHVLYEVHGPWANFVGYKGRVYFTNQIVMVLLAALLMLIVFPWLAARAKKSPVPTGIHNFFEAIMSFLRTEVFRPTLGDNADRFAISLDIVLLYFVLQSAGHVADWRNFYAG